jgi:hypothetical protein
MRPLLASTDSIFASLIHAFSWYVHNFVSNLHMDGYEFDLPCVWNVPDDNVVFDGILREKTSYTIIFNNLILWVMEISFVKYRGYKEPNSSVCFCNGWVSENRVLASITAIDVH